MILKKILTMGTVLCLCSSVLLINSAAANAHALNYSSRQIITVKSGQASISYEGGFNSWDMYHDSSIPNGTVTFPKGLGLTLPASLNKIDFDAKAATIYFDSSYQDKVKKGDGVFFCLSHKHSVHKDSHCELISSSGSYGFDGVITEISTSSINLSGKNMLTAKVVFQGDSIEKFFKELKKCGFEESEVSIFKQENTKIVTIPKECVFKDENGKPYVWLVGRIPEKLSSEDDVLSAYYAPDKYLTSPKKQEVTLGKSNNSEIEILSGLKALDIIILPF